MTATPVGVSTSTTSRSQPASRSPDSASSANESRPTAPTKRTRAPRRAAPTAWFAPLPPGAVKNSASVSVSPGLGRRSTRATRSRFAEPTTVSATSGGKRAQVLDRAPEQVLAQVEEPGPERRAVGSRAHPGGRRETLERSHENGQLEIGLRHPHLGDAHARPCEHRAPVQELGDARLSVPGAALGMLGLELEKVARERALQAGECRLRSLGRAAERRLAPPGGARLRLSPTPALQQPAEGERRDLARRQLRDEACRGVLLGGVFGEDVGPTWLHAYGAHAARTPDALLGVRRRRG